MQTGRFEEAAVKLKLSLELRPDNGDGWAILGSVYKQENKLTDALDALNKAVELMPAHQGHILRVLAF